MLIMLIPLEILMDFRACDNLIAAEDRIKLKASQVRLQGDLPLAKIRIKKEEGLTSINEWHRRWIHSTKAPWTYRLIPNIV